MSTSSCREVGSELKVGEVGSQVGSDQTNERTSVAMVQSRDSFHHLSTGGKTKLAPNILAMLTVSIRSNDSIDADLESTSDFWKFDADPSVVLVRTHALPVVDDATAPFPS